MISYDIVLFVFLIEREVSLKLLIILLNLFFRDFLKNCIFSVFNLYLKFISIVMEINLEDWKNIYMFLKIYLNLNIIFVIINRNILNIMI